MVTDFWSKVQKRRPEVFYLSGERKGKKELSPGGCPSRFYFPRGEKSLSFRGAIKGDGRFFREEGGGFLDGPSEVAYAREKEEGRKDAYLEEREDKEGKF